MVRNNAWNCQRTLIEYLYLGAKNPRIHNFVLKEVNENTTKVSASSHVVLGSTSLNRKAAIRRSLPLRHYTPYLGPVRMPQFWPTHHNSHCKTFRIWIQDPPRSNWPKLNPAEKEQSFLVEDRDSWADTNKAWVRLSKIYVHSLLVVF